MAEGACSTELTRSLGSVEPVQSGGMRRTASAILAVGLLVTPVVAQHPAAPVPSALEPASTGGLVSVDRALAKLSTHKRLLVIGAHPDDEDSALLALVGRRWGGEAAYLSLSRGEGGQNLIGPELGVGLGVIRTGELLAARRIDGSRQFFARAFDFGYTRSLEEAFERWPREVLLEDAVRVVRRFKPQVIVAVFPPDARAGHGQHQASAVIAGDVYTAAGPPDRYPELTAGGLPQWQPLAFYRRTWWSLKEATLSYSLGVIDSLDGRSVLQLAAASRSQHRSQDMGMLQPLGPREGGLAWVAGGAGAAGSEVFAGIDTRLTAIAASLADGASRARLERVLQDVEATARAARRKLSPTNLDGVIPDLAGIVQLLAGVLDELGGLDSPEAAAAGALVREKLAVAEAGLAAAASVAVEAVADRESAAAGERLEVTTAVWNAGRQRVAVERVALASSVGWRVTPENGVRREIGVGALEEWRFAVQVSPEGEPTLPYYLGRPRQGDLYDWTGVSESVRGEPAQPPPVVARFVVRIGETPVTLEREVVHRYRDQAVGEVRRPLRAVPTLEVAVEPQLIVWPLGREGRQELEVTVTSHSVAPVAGNLELRLRMAGPSYAVTSFEIEEPRGRQVVRLALTRPEGGCQSFEGRVSAVLESGERFDTALPLLDYPHIRPVPMVRTADVKLRLVDLELPPLGRIGYVRGASDRVPEALRRIGLPVELLGPGELSSVDLSDFDAVVVGARAYEIEPALAAVNARLMDWVRGGGLLIVQYHKYPFVEGGFAPFPLSIGRPHGRVTDERSPVRLLEPEHPVFNRPNRITDADWEGWVQERGLYFAESWDEAYRPLLAMRDPGRAEELGSLLLADVGAGRYIYTGLSFFRQLPAGVPGAFRVFANLLALGG